MKTPEQKLKFVMEAAGECVHEFPQQGLVGKVAGGHNIYCEKGCMIFVADGTKYKHPSPDDIGKLMELAEKLDAFVILHFGRGDVSASAWVHLKGHTKVEGGTPAEALLNALFVAKGGLEDE